MSNIGFFSPHNSELPPGWNKSRYKYHVSIENGYPFNSELFDSTEGFPLIRIRDITSGNVETFYKGDVLSDFVVSKDDLLIGMDGDFNCRWWEGPESLLNQRCCRIRERSSFYRRFLFYVLPLQLKVINDLTHFTTVKHLSSDDLLNQSCWIPPLEEQQLISRYLDKKTEQIDSLVEKIQKKIELLKEQRTSSINQFITKGLDPNVEMRDSGVEWIGEIPSHWGVIKIGHYSNIIRGSSPRPAGDPRLFGGSFIPWITVREVTNQETKYIRSTETSLTEEGMKKSTKVYPGTLLFSNSGATLGVPRFTEIEGCINDGSVAFLDIRPSLLPEFLYWFLTTQTTRLRSEQSGFGQPNLNTEIVSNIKVPLPPIDEQNIISTKIEKTSRQIDELIFLLDRKSNVLTEYRQSLISSVVTGKVRVTKDMV